MSRLAVLLFLAAGATSDSARLGAQTRAEVVFTGMCDASGAIAISDSLFAVANDEDNVLRVYDSAKGGAPLYSEDISDGIRIPRARAKKTGTPGPAPEADIEGATRIGDLAFWITSHGRSSSGKLRLERLRFFATNVPRDGAHLAVVGVPYEKLLEDLIGDPGLQHFGLEAAAQLAPKAPGGFNIEGLTARQEGGVFIGFRSPTPEARALVVVLLNPEQVVRGERPKLGEPALLDLAGLGIRSLSWWRGRYLIAAGSDTGPSRVFSWDGRNAPQPLPNVDLTGFNPEAFFTPEGRDEIMLLSDDGTSPIDGVECKSLPDAARKRFRGVWLPLH